MRKIYLSFITLPGRSTTWHTGFNEKLAAALPASETTALCKTETKYAPMYYLGDAFTARPWLTRVPYGYN